MKRAARGPLTIRVRLGAALAAALAPVLFLGAAQSIVAMQRDTDERRLLLTAAAERSAAVARADMRSAEVILETLTPEAVGLQCAPRLRQLNSLLPGYANLIRFDGAGRVECAAGTIAADPGRQQSDWFRRLTGGAQLAVASAPPGVYADEPAVIAALRQNDAAGRFDGALAAVIRLSSLNPDLSDRSLPAGTQVALADGKGRFLIQSDAKAFAAVAPSRLRPDESAVIFRGRDRLGDSRVFAAAPLVNDVFVVLSAPAPGLFSWARLNPLSTVLLPLAAFVAALLAVWIVAERVVIRWLHYLERVASIYAKGRFTVRPLQASRGPPEIRALGHALEVMADAIAGRDLTLQENLAQKDALMREIHHRVKNNLQVISSLLNMQQRALADPAARRAIYDTRQRIGALALIYRALYQGPDLRRVDLRSFLEELIGQLMAPETANGPTIRTELEAQELSIDPDKLAPLALFAVEAISNARKHAFADGGVLHIRFRLDGDEASLEIADQGSKIAPAVVGDGVGRTLMIAFARQLRGRLDIEPNAFDGVTVRLAFPAPEAQPSGLPPSATPAGAAASAPSRQRGKAAA